MTRRRFLRLSVALGAGTVLSACAATPATQGQPPAGEQVSETQAEPAVAALKEATIRLAHFEGDLGTRNYSRVAELLRSRHPQLTLTPEPTWDEAKFLIQAAAGDAPDIMYTTEQYVPVFAAKGALLDLTPLADADDQFSLDDYYQNLVDFYSYENRLVGLPRLFSPYVLWYNLNMFDAKGLAYPDDNWDWNSFLEAAIQLAGDSDGDGQKDTWAYECTAHNNGWMPWVWSNGGELMNEDYTQFLLDQDQALEGLQFYLDLMYEHSVAPQLTLQENSLITPFGFSTGSVAMVENARFMLPLYTQIEDFKFDIAPVPKGAAGRVTTMPTGGFSAAVGAKHPRETWECIKFLTGPEAQAIYASSRQAMPALRNFTAVALDPTLPPANDKLFIEAIEYARPVHRCPYFREAWEPINSKLQLVWTGRAGLYEALAEAVPQANSILADLIAAS